MGRHYITTCLVFTITFLSAGPLLAQSYGKNTDFDIFIFTQHWPVTTCIDFEAKDPRNGCSPIVKSTFTVHGLWPTKYHKIEPLFCNNTWHFNRDDLMPIMENLTQYWPDYEIRNVTDSLWRHEWSKHGTCAATLPAFDSELKYFQAGVDLAMLYPIGLWLQQKNIVPGYEYSKQELWDTILENSNTRPHIDCEHLKDRQFIKEIKLCFTKELAPTDCDGIVQASGQYGKMLGTCRDDQKVFIPEDPLKHPSTLVIVMCTTLGILVLMTIVYAAGKIKTPRRGYESI